MKKVLILFVLILLFSSVNVYSEQHNGVFWKNLNKTQKIFYIDGFTEGILLGYRFSYLGLSKDNTALCYLKVMNSYLKQYNEFIAIGKTVGDLADELDNFYSYFENRNIFLVDGFWIVLNIMNGKPDAYINDMVKKYRKHESDK
jgi:hypothetical protein